MFKNLPKVLLPLSMTFLLAGCLAGGTPANEWVISQYDEFSGIQSFCAKLDDSVSLYLSGAIEEGVYLEDISQLDQELSGMEKAKGDENIKPGTFTENTMAAKEGYDDIWKSLRTLIDTMQTDETVLNDKDALSYLYLAYHDQMKKDVNKYITGYNEAVTAETKEEE